MNYHKAHGTVTSVTILEDGSHDIVLDEVITFQIESAEALITLEEDLAGTDYTQYLYGNLILAVFFGNRLAFNPANLAFSQNGPDAEPEFIGFNFGMVAGEVTGIAYDDEGGYDIIIKASSGEVFSVFQDDESPPAAGTPAEIYSSPDGEVVALVVGGCVIRDNTPGQQFKPPAPPSP